MTVSDADRERVIALLREQAGEGRLDMDEFGQRLDEAYQAASLDDLQHALRELPVPAVKPPPSQSPDQFASPKPPPSSIRRDHRHRPHGGPRPPALTPQARAAMAKAAWKGHLYTYVWVNLLLVFIWLMTGAGYPWPMWSIGPWGIGLAAHGSAHRAATRVRKRRYGELEEG